MYGVFEQKNVENANLLIEDVVPLVPDEVESGVPADRVEGDGRDDAAPVLLPNTRVGSEGHVQVPGMM